MQFRKTLVMLLSCLTLSSCGLSGSIDRATDKAVRVIEEGINDIRHESASWQNVLQEVSKELPEEISENIRKEAEILVSKSIAKAGVEFRCNTDFLSKRAINSLLHLKAKLLKKNLPPLPPEFCGYDPEKIDLKKEPASGWEMITLSGYDLDQKDSKGKRMTILLLDDKGNLTPLSEDNIIRATHYEVKLNLSDMGRELHEKKIKKLLVSWDGSTDGFTQIGVLPWKPKKLEPKTEISFLPPYQPPHKGKGDRDFDTDDDEPTEFEVRGIVRTDNAKQNLEGRVYLYAKELEEDWTQIEGYSPWRSIYQAPPNYKIISFSPNSMAKKEGMITSTQPLSIPQEGGTVVKEFKLSIDRDGDEAGTWSNVIVEWRQLTVTLEETAPKWLTLHNQGITHKTIPEAKQPIKSLTGAKKIRQE